MVFDALENGLHALTIFKTCKIFEGDDGKY